LSLVINFLTIDVLTSVKSLAASYSCLFHCKL